MKSILVLIFCFFTTFVFGQTEVKELDAHNGDAPYLLIIPKDWGVERFAIPISFAPEINYTGVEDLRFTPGWGKKESEEYWTYSFLWYLDGKIEMNVELLVEQLNGYYSGLLKVNSDSALLATEKPISTITSFKKIEADKEDLETYQGSIEMKDFISRQPIKLNCRVHIRNCSDDKTAIYFELSPQPFDHSNWENLNNIWKEFRCKK